VTNGMWWATINQKIDWGGFGPSSMHPGGCQFLLCDGSVRFVSETVDMTTSQALSTRNGRETISQF
jgi:prepilin-type processing-associated H-X9-DG protein